MKGQPYGIVEVGSVAQGRLGGGVRGLEYERLESHRDRSIRSEILGLGVRVDDHVGKHHLRRSQNPKTGRHLPMFEEFERFWRLAEEELLEESAARREAERADRAEIEARRDAEVEVAHLKTYIAGRKGCRGGSPGSDS